MSDVNTESITEPDAPANDTADSVFHVRIAKGGKDATVQFDVAELSTEAYRQVLQLGLEAIANARMTKVPGPKAIEEKPSIAHDGRDSEGHVIEGAYSMAKRIATENLSNLKAGQLKAKGKSAKSTLPREVNTEAMRIARNMVKDAIRAAKGYPSTYPASEITAMAKKFMEAKPEIVAQAHENVNKRKDLEKATAGEINVLALGRPDPKLEAARIAKAAEAEAKKASRPLSAKQAGKTSARGSVPPAARKTRGDAPAIMH